MAKLTGFGISVDLPQGWDGAIRRRVEAPDAGTTHPVLHGANFALPLTRGDFGSGAVEVMGPGDILVVLLEYHPDAGHTALFRHQGLPVPLSPDRFSPAGLQRVIPGQSGTQEFFSLGGRAWSLYVVLGSHSRRSGLVPLANLVLATLLIESLVP
jgi:hypothetical protein